MGLVAGDRPSYYYDPGSSCSDGDLELVAGTMLDDEIAVDIRDGGEGNAWELAALLAKMRSGNGRATVEEDAHTGTCALS